MVRLKHLGGLSIPLDEPERLAGRSVRTAGMGPPRDGAGRILPRCAFRSTLDSATETHLNQPGGTP